MEEKRFSLERVLREMTLETERWQREALLRYDALLQEECVRQRLVGDAGDVIVKHIPDSLYPLVLLRIGPGKMLDLGTGAGLPGIPLKIFLPGNPLYLLDSHGRRLSFLRRAVDELGLKDTFFLHGRAEEFGRDPLYREKFAWVAVRAVERAAVLMELALPFLALGGKMFIYKGIRGRAEIKQAAFSLAACGGELEQDWSYRLPSGEGRTLFLIRKVRPTPPRYPRRPGFPSKRPLGSQRISNA